MTRKNRNKKLQPEMSENIGLTHATKNGNRKNIGNENLKYDKLSENTGFMLLHAMYKPEIICGSIIHAMYKPEIICGSIIHGMYKPEIICGSIIHDMYKSEIICRGFRHAMYKSDSDGSAYSII